MTLPKYKNFFGKGYTTSWSEDAFVLKKAKNTVALHTIFTISTMKKLLDCFMKIVFHKFFYEVAWDKSEYKTERARK